MSQFPAYILAGGKSSRFGSDKALAELDGTPLILHVARVLRRVCASVTVVSEERGKYAALGLATGSDLLLARGPLGGLHAALREQIDRSTGGWIVLASCDLVGLQPEWLETIICQIEATRIAVEDGSQDTSIGHAAAAPKAIAFRGAFWQPFPSAVHTSAFDVVCSLLESGKASFQRLLSDPRMNTIALPMPNDWPEVVQVNTPAELEIVRKSHMAMTGQDDR